MKPALCLGHRNTVGNSEESTNSKFKLGLQDVMKVYLSRQVDKTYLTVFFIICIYFWHWVFVVACRPPLAVEIRGYSSVAVRGFLVVVASLVAEHRL